MQGAALRAARLRRSRPHPHPKGTPRLRSGAAQTQKTYEPTARRGKPRRNHAHTPGSPEVSPAPPSSPSPNPPRAPLRGANGGTGSHHAKAEHQPDKTETIALTVTTPKWKLSRPGPKDRAGAITPTRKPGLKARAEY
jgi:hypothetical protein